MLISKRYFTRTGDEAKRVKGESEMTSGGGVSKPLFVAFKLSFPKG